MKRLNKIIFVLYWTGIILITSSFAHQRIFEKIAVDMETRSATAGKSTQIKASIFYSSEGKMVSYYTVPQEMVIVNNKKGEIIIYNPLDNTVLQQQNFTMGTETTQLYFFLENKRGDLGLSGMGYTLKATRFEDGLKITSWSPPMQLATQLSKVELVHEKGNPIYMGYLDSKGRVIKKTFFYNYARVSEDISFPSAVTQIDFKTPKDSIVTKTTYSQFHLNQQVSDEKLNYSVPSNAKVITR
jgi:outer membrane lipoprotein-sorting protein